MSIITSSRIIVDTLVEGSRIDYMTSLLHLTIHSYYIFSIKVIVFFSSAKKLSIITL